MESTLGAVEQWIFRGRSCEATLRSSVRKHGAPGKLFKELETARQPEERYPPFQRGQLVTEGARVEQVGEELSRRAVVWVVMSWPSEPDHPLGCVSSAHVIDPDEVAQRASRAQARETKRCSVMLSWGLRGAAGAFWDCTGCRSR